MKRLRGIPAADPSFEKDAYVSTSHSTVQPYWVTRESGAEESRQELANGLE